MKTIKAKCHLITLLAVLLPGFLYADPLSLSYAVYMHKYPGAQPNLSRDAAETHIAIARLLNELGDLYTNLNNYERAIEKYEEALIHYANGRLYTSYGRSLFRVKQYDRAIKAYKIAGALGAEIDAETYFEMACAYSRMKKVGMAFEYLDLAIMSGFHDLNKIKNAQDLEFLHDQPEWQTWLNEKDTFFMYSALLPGKIPLRPVAEYLFNGDACDNSANRNHGIVINAQPAQDRFGIPNSAYYFSGAGDCIKVINPKGLPQGDKPKTIAAWFKFESDLHNKHADIGGFGASNRGSNFQIGTKYGEFIVWGWTDPYDWYTGILTKNYIDKKWHFVAVVYDGNTTSLYIDTERVAYTTKYRWNTEPQKIIIGNEIDEQGHEFIGFIDDFRIYDRALSEDEIIQLYQIPGP